MRIIDAHLHLFPPSPDTDAMAEGVGEIVGVGGAGGDGGRSAALFQLWEEREGRRKFLRLE